MSGPAPLSRPDGQGRRKPGRADLVAVAPDAAVPLRPLCIRSQEFLMQRRALIAWAGARAAVAAVAALAAVAAPRPAAAHPTWEGLREARRRLRRHAPHRIHAQMLQGRLVWVVPHGVTVGWELLHDERRVRVRGLRHVQHEGAPRELARVVDATGQVRELEIVRDAAA
jgi:hypothetical protein